MRNSAIFYISISTILLLTVAVLVFYNVRYDVVLFAVIAGQAWWLLTVYKVLTDNYSTDKTFDDWYEDHPIRKE